MRRALHLFPLNNNLKVKNGTSHLNPRWLEDGLVQHLLVSLDSVLNSNSINNSSLKAGSNISHNRKATIKTMEKSKSIIKVRQTKPEIFKVATIRATRAIIRILVSLITAETLMVGTNHRTHGKENNTDRVQMNNLVIMEIEEAVAAESFVVDGAQRPNRLGNARLDVGQPRHFIP